jgi:hypothetical protein
MPRHLTLWRKGQLIAAAPAWAKEDSDGDFARDWDLASASSGARLRYYTKLAVTVPFTPCTGERVLVAPGEDRQDAVERLVRGAIELCKSEGFSTFQVLFPDQPGARELSQTGLAPRVSHQFHWTNEGYRSMDDFLARFNSKRRHMLRREMAAAQGQGVTIRTVRGEEIARDPARWARTAHALHRNTVDKLMWGRRWLNEEFYQLAFAGPPAASTAAIGALSRSCRSCTSTSATIIPSPTALPAACASSRAARAASTSWRAASCQSSPGRRTPSSTRVSTAACASTCASRRRSAKRAS